MNSSKWLATVPVLVALTFTAACATANDGTKASEIKGLTSTVASSTRPSAALPQRVTHLEVSSNADFFGLDRLSNCDGQMRNRPLKDRKLFDPEEGVFVPIPVPSVQGTDEFVEAGCTVAQNRAGELRIVNALTAKTPSVGLTPESIHTDLSVFDGSSTVPLHTQRLPDVLQYSKSVLSPSKNGFNVTISNSDGDVLDSVRYFDPDTLQLTANVAPTRDAGYIAGVNNDGYAIAGLPPNAGVIQFFSTDGTKLGEFSDFRDVASTDNGFLMGRVGDRPDAGVYYFDMRSKDISGPIAPGMPKYDVATFVSGLSGETHFYHNYNGNSYGDLLLLKGRDSDGKQYLKIYDTVAKKELYQLTDEQITSLKVDLDDTSLGGDFLYLKKDPDNPVINWRTGATAASGWTLLPVAPFADGWVLLKRSNPENDTTGYFIARGPEGPYAGPWF